MNPAGATERPPTTPGQPIAGLGEFGLIAALAARFPSAPAATVGIGDDSAVLATPDGNVVAAVDFLIEGRHFLRAWSSGHDAGVKAAARGLADIAAMGAVPTALLIALALPGSLPADWALDLASGIAAECGRAGVGVVGGDTARADMVIISVTALGSLPAGMAAVRRRGARPGDIVAVAGPLGHSAAGLALLCAGLPGKELIASHLRPAPPYDAGPEAARLGATAMIDTSDGLLADLGHVAEASGVAIDIATAALDFGEPLARAAGAVSGLFVETGRGFAAAPAKTLEWVLTGGEDHSLAATFPATASLPPRWRAIGTVHAGSGVTVDGAPYGGPGGWQHFLSWGIHTNPPRPPWSSRVAVRFIGLRRTGVPPLRSRDPRGLARSLQAPLVPRCASRPLFPGRGCAARCLRF